MNNELYHYGVVGMKWGVRKSIGSSSNNRSIGFNRARHTNYEIKRARQIANAGKYNGSINTGARALSIGLTVINADKVGRVIAKTAAIKVAKLGGVQASKAAAVTAVGGTAAWAAVMALSARTVERNIAAEVYSRNKDYKKKIDSIANEDLYRRNK